MSFALAQKVADAILYEGYVLYPYRASSAKNRVRFQFGVVAPRGGAEPGGSDSWEMQTECLVEPGTAPALRFKVRFLQLQARSVEAVNADAPGGFAPVEFLDLGDERVVAWDEGVERGLEVGDIPLGELLLGERVETLELPGGEESEELRSGEGDLVGRFVRRRWPISLVIRLSAATIGTADGLVRLRVRIENRVPWPEGTPPDREMALRQSLLGAHTLLAVRGGAFVSLLDPSPEAAEAAAACKNLYTWPVLIGPEESRDVVLSSPIILYDHPAIAPESPGDLCDALEIDEILTLRIMTLTDEEKREARGTDARARQIVSRSDNIPPEIMERLHGAMRSLSSARPAFETPTTGGPPENEENGENAEPIANGPSEPGDPTLAASPFGWEGAADEPRPISAELASWEEFLNPPGMAPPEEATIAVGGVTLARGSRVILRPSRRSDSMDIFLVGRPAKVAAIYRDLEGESYLAVLLEDDPAADLHAWFGRYFYFYPEEVEPLAADASEAPSTGAQPLIEAAASSSLESME